MTDIRTAAGSLSCEVVPEDTEVLGFGVGAITAIEIRPGTDAAPLLRELDAWCDDHRIRLMSCRLDHLRLTESMTLEAHGFRFVEMVYRPRLEGLDQVAEPEQPIAIREAGPEDLAAVEGIAHVAFTTGRLALDPRLDPDLSRRRYANWVRTSFENAAHSVLEARIEDELVGFFVVERQPDGAMYWHLTAVAPAWQGKRIGTSLWRSMLLRHQAEGIRRVETTVSGHNPAVMNLYARLGFSFAEPRMTFHWLRSPA